MELKFGVCHCLQCAAFGFVLYCTHSANGTELDGGEAHQDSYVAIMLPECACGERCMNTINLAILANSPFFAKNFIHGDIKFNATCLNKEKINTH